MVYLLKNGNPIAMLNNQRLLIKTMHIDSWSPIRNPFARSPGENWDPKKKTILPDPALEHIDFDACGILDDSRCSHFYLLIIYMIVCYGKKKSLSRQIIYNWDMFHSYVEQDKEDCEK